MFKALFKYGKDGEMPNFEDVLLNTIFFLFKATLDRDAERYEKVCERNKVNAKKAGRPSKNTEDTKENNPVVFLDFQNNPKVSKKSDMDRDIEKDIDKDIDKERNTNTNSTSSFSSKKVYGDLFSEFWSLYPKKIGKGGANKVFERLKLNSNDLLQIKNALKWQKQSEQWQKNGGQFIPNPSTYLSQRRWEDEPFEASMPDYTNPDRYDDVYNNDLPF